MTHINLVDTKPIYGITNLRTTYTIPILPIPSIREKNN